MAQVSHHKGLHSLLYSALLEANLNDNIYGSYTIFCMFKGLNQIVAQVSHHKGLHSLLYSALLEANLNDNIYGSYTIFCMFKGLNQSTLSDKARLLGTARKGFPS